MVKDLGEERKLNEMPSRAAQHCSAGVSKTEADQVGSATTRRRVASVLKCAANA